RRHASWYCRVWAATLADPSSRNTLVSADDSFPRNTSPARSRTSLRSASMLHSIAPDPKHPPGSDVEVLVDVDVLVLLDVLEEVELDVDDEVLGAGMLVEVVLDELVEVSEVLVDVVEV